MYILERGKWREKERKRKRKRNMDVREKHQLAAFCMHPDEGLNLLPRHVP